jgi:hypothetical protein
VPFRLERDEEIVALWLIEQADDWYWPSPMWADGLMPITRGRSVLADTFGEFYVRGDADDGLGAAQVEALRAELRRALAGRAHTDLLHETPRGDEMRLAPWVLLPEDRIFFGILHPEGQPPVAGAGFPCGPAVTTALGSPLLRDVLAVRGLGAPEDGGSLLEGATWVAAAHRMRASLLDPAEPDAPALFSSLAWQRKSLRTALGSWALERNVWTLHSHEVMSFLGGPKQLPGLVEPDPDVFARLAAMGRLMLVWIRDSDADGEAMRLEHAEHVLAFARSTVANLLDPDGDLEYEEYFIRRLEKLGVLTSEEGSAAWRRIPQHAAWGVPKRWRKREPGTPEPDYEAEIRVVRERLAPIIAACERWHARMSDLSVKLDAPVPGAPLWECWIEWVRLCTRLELLAHKQLRQRPWSDDDARFLKEFGVALGEVMGYSLGSVQHPEDDAPRAASVICDPSNDVMRVVGTGRPRELWVLYPYRGEKVVCRGVVLSYYELDAKDAPTDAEWKAMLDSKDPPPEPPWITGP